REVLRRGLLHRAQPQLPRSALGAFPQGGGRPDGGLRHSRGEEKEAGRMKGISQLVIAGWTGRDEAALRKHIRELEDIGVKPPKTTPIFYRVSALLITHAAEIQVSGGDTSGEVEFVLLAKPDGLWVTVGSDHTDRKAETIGGSLSKPPCARPVAE